MKRIIPLLATPAVFVAFILGAEQPPPQTSKIGLPDGVRDTQKPGDVPPSPEESVGMFELPEGFRANLFAGEPDVHQPIAMTFDPKGRLWVAECYSYPDWQPKGPGKDRILILEDRDGDGQFDHRTVFWDKAYNLTSVEVGNGGVYALCSPHLLFIPDRNGDGQPDGEPQVLLEGFTLKAKHNVVNGLTWGPDGWLYGRHGITSESRVGPPGTPENERTRLNCSIWRYHPTRRIFEVVADGTTNPWGLDWDDHGEGFFTNCVIGHLWHLVPGARYKRMFGTDYNPYAYELIDQAADHLHWGGGDWTTSRGGQGVHSEAGGGHAHSGALVYLGDNWPQEYRGSILMCNLHGNRLNRDRLEREGCSYVGNHAPDMFHAKTNPWFRGVAMTTGPDGAVYVSDWTDLGECHDNDGVHRSSGRIYRFSYGDVRFPTGLDLAALPDAELIQLQLHRNDWYVRQARRVLIERAASGKNDDVHKALRAMFDHQRDPTRRLRAMWALYATGGADSEWLLARMDDPNEHVRSWAVRLACDEGLPPAEVRAKFRDMAGDDSSGLVRLYLAAMLQKLPREERFPIVERLAAHAEDADDRCQPMMIWLGIEPAIPSDPERASALAVSTKIPKLRHWIARRITEHSVTDLVHVLNVSIRLDDADRVAMLDGIRLGLRGRKQVSMPKNWPQVAAQLRESDTAEVRRLTDALALTFGEPGAVDRIRATVVDANEKADLRATALSVLVDGQVPKLQGPLFDLLAEPDMRGPAIRALAAYPDERTPTRLLSLYPKLTESQQQDVISTLASRPGFASALLDAMENGTIPRRDVSAFTARQLIALDGGSFRDRVTNVWGQLRNSSKEKQALIAKFEAELTSEVLNQANLSAGREVYRKTCGQCHQLFGEGGDIGPNLTGSDRRNTYYILENMIDPSKVIGREYRLTNVTTLDGRLISGIVVEQTNQAVTVRTATERLVIPRDDIDEMTPSNVSMMPEGQIDQMTPAQLRDLVGYLRAERQVPLPANRE